MSDFAQLVVQLELQQAQFTKGMNDAARRLETMSQNSRKTQQSVAKLAQGMDGLRTAVVAAGSAFAAFRTVQALTKASDQINNLRGSFEALLGDSGRAADMMQRVFGIVERTGTPLEAAAGATQRLTIALKDMGASNRQIETVAETFIKLGKVGGSSTEDVANGLRQMGQALASGQLSGDELKSIRENVPLVAQALAEALNVPVGKLKELGEQGKLTGPVVANALIAAAASANAAFAKMPISFEQALNKMEAQATRFGAALDKSAGISTTLVKLADHMAETLKRWTAELESTNGQLTQLQSLAEFVGNIFNIIAAGIVALGFAIEAVVKRLGFIGEQIKLLANLDFDGVTESTKRFNAELEKSFETAERTIRSLLGMQNALSDAQRAAGRSAARGDELRPQAPLKAPPGSSTGGGDIDKLKKETEALQKRADAIAASVNPQFAYNVAMAEMNKLLEAGLLSETNYALAKQKAIELLNAEAEAVRQMIDPTRQYQQELQKVNALYMAGKIEIEELIKAQEILKKKADEAMGGEKVKSFKEQVKELADTIGDALGDAFADVITGAATAEEAFKKFAQTVIEEIAQIVAKAAAAWVVKTLFGSAAGGAGGGGAATQSAAAGRSVQASIARMAQGAAAASFTGRAATNLAATGVPGSSTAGIALQRPELKVTVNNNAGDVVTTRQGDDGGLEITIDRVRQALSRDMRRGGNIFADTLERSYAMQRRGV